MIEDGKGINSKGHNTEKFLLEHGYGGNIRELKNKIERMVLLSKAGVLKVASNDNRVTVIKENEGNEVLSYKQAKEQFEKQYICEVLQSCENNITKAAIKMGLSRR